MMYNCVPMHRTVAVAWLLMTLFCLASTRAAQGSAAPQQWDFAQHLFIQGEYYRAITEFKRFIYYFPDDERVGLAHLKVTEAYVRGRWWREGLRSAQDALTGKLNPELRSGIYFLQGICYLRLQQAQEAMDAFEQVLALTHNAALREQAQYLKARALLREDLWKEAIEVLEKVNPLSALGASARQGAASIRSHTPPKDKSPWVAGLLAAVLPGAGHLYAERWRDAGLVFAVNGAFTGATLEAIDKENPTLAGVLAFTELIWYSGNIFSAVGSAHKHNRRLRDELSGYVQLPLDAALRPLQSNGQRKSP
jgi:tetratricopeptide (TPR) repeat protein